MTIEITSSGEFRLIEERAIAPQIIPMCSSYIAPRTHYVILYKLYREGKVLFNCWVGHGLYDDPDTALLHGKEVCANTTPGNILVCELQTVRSS